MRILLITLLLLQASVGRAEEIVCTPQNRTAPTSTDPVVREIITAVTTIAQSPLVAEMAHRQGYNFEFCWIPREGQGHPLFAKNIGTMYFNGTRPSGEKISGIFYSVQMLNEVLSHADKAEDAFLPALFVLYHEIGHMMAYMLKESGELTRAIRTRNVLFKTLPLVDKYSFQEARLYDSISGQKWGSEAFADCYGSYLMGLAMIYHAPNRQRTFFEYLARRQFNEQNFHTALQLAAGIASQLVGQDEHGTAIERQSFVGYGVNVAGFYLPLLTGPNQVGAANSAVLACANMAFDQSAAKAAFYKTWGRNTHLPAALFDRSRGY